MGSSSSKTAKTKKKPQPKPKKVRRQPSLPSRPPPTRPNFKTAASNRGKVNIDKRFSTIKNKKISSDDFQTLKVLGKGSFGKVIQVKHKTTGEILAMKVLKKNFVSMRNQVEHTKTERRVLGKLQNPFFVQLRYAFQSATKLYMVMEYAKGGELFYHLSKVGRFEESRARFYSAEVVIALEYLHGQNIIYRDLKPENLLLDEYGHIKLTDFGLSKEAIDDKTKANSFCGTPEYLAPEILLRKGHGKPADWWSLGALTFELLTGTPPFYGGTRDKLFKTILAGKIRFPRYVTTKSRDFVKALMTKDVKKRLGYIGASEVKRHVFFQGCDWPKMEKRQVTPPFKPSQRTDKSGAVGTDNFDPEFTNMAMTFSLKNTSQVAKTRKYSDFTYVDAENQNRLVAVKENVNNYYT